MTEMQSVVFGILKFIREKCRQNNLTYYLAYGTLLGAVRHKGYIPWDDDIDLWMPRSDYMRFLEILKGDCDERYALCQGEYKPEGDRPEVLQMRVIDKKVMIARDYSTGKKINSYPWIDIFALDRYPKDKKDGYIKAFKKELFLYKVSRAKRYLIKEKSVFGLMNAVIYTLHTKLGMFKKCLDEDKHIERAYKCLSQYAGSKLEDEGIFCYAAVYLPQLNKCLFEKEWFAGTALYEFEGERFSGPVDAHGVLTAVYNDYMTLPPAEQRVNTHQAHIIKRAD